MKNEKNYFLYKDNKKGEMLYVEYEKMDGYHVAPKAKKQDAIAVNKIVFISPTLSEKLIRKKIEKKISYLLAKLNEIDEDQDPTGEGIRQTLVEAERFKLMLINKYIKYLGHTYGSLTLKKISIIINQLRYKLFMLKDISYQDTNTEFHGKGR